MQLRLRRSICIKFTEKKPMMMIDTVKIAKRLEQIDVLSSISVLKTQILFILTEAL